MSNLLASFRDNAGSFLATAGLAVALAFGGPEKAIAQNQGTPKDNFNANKTEMVSAKADTLDWGGTDLNIIAEERNEAFKTNLETYLPNMKADLKADLLEKTKRVNSTLMVDGGQVVYNPVELEKIGVTTAQANELSMLSRDANDTETNLQNFTPDQFRKSALTVLQQQKPIAVVSIAPKNKL